jgi:type VI secretion system protein ImpA
VLNGLLEKYWDGVHPQLDPEDGNDPTLRVNTIAGLTDPSAMLRAVQGAPLIAPRGMRKITFKDVQIAAGELPQPAGAEKIEQSTIDGAFSECNPDELLKAGKVAKQALDGVRQLEATIGEKVGVANGPELEPLLDILKPISKLLDQKITARGLDSPEEASAPAASASAAADERAEGNGEAGSAAANGRKAGAVVNVTGDITSREDVIRALDRICDYYKRYEPSSPVPLFLNRAKRLASKSFLEILRDLTPDAVNQALALSGITEGAAAGATVDANDI